MAKKITAKQLKELEHIKEWCLTIIDFMTLHYGKSQVFKQYLDIIIDGYQNQNLSGLKYIYRDTNEWAKGISRTDLDELNKLLHDKFGESLVKKNNENLSEIKKVVKKGKISNEDEYRLLLSRVDEIYENKNKEKELEILNKLLADYHKS